jgi:hypothetical protein
VSLFAAGVGVGVETHNKVGEETGGTEVGRRWWNEAAAAGARSFEFFSIIGLSTCGFSKIGLSAHNFSRIALQFISYFSFGIISSLMRINEFLYPFCPRL